MLLFNDQLASEYYRYTKLVAGEMTVGEIPALKVAHKILVTPRKRRGIPAVDDSDSRRIDGVPSGSVVGTVGNDCIVVGKVEEVLHNEMVSGGRSFIIGLLVNVLWAKPAMEKLRCLHRSMVPVKDKTRGTDEERNEQY